MSHAEVAVTRFSVSFYNDLPDPYGHERHVCQRALEVETDLGEEQAIADAIAEFERRERVDHWRKRARTIECRRLTPS